MTIPVVVVGAGGFGREICDVIEAVNLDASGTYELLGVLDDAPSETNLERLRSRGIAYLGNIRDYADQHLGTKIAYFIGINNPTTKRLIAAVLDDAGFISVPLVHPTASLGSRVTLADGSVVCAGVRLTTNIQVGRHVHLNLNVTVGHDTNIGDYVSVNPLASISGDVIVEDGVTIGASAFILQGLTLRAGSVVGASSCVVRSVPSHTVVKGIPAK